MMALRARAAGSVQVGACSSSGRCAVPLARLAGAASRRCVVTRAAAEEVPVAPVAQPQTPPTLTWPVDTETARDVFAFGGSLPERLNGRVAMMGWAGIALAELKSGVPAAEQFGSDIGGVLLLSVTLMLASLFPKFVSGSSLKDLHASATSENLKGGEGIGAVLGLFDQGLELWTGRAAMIGIVGLLVVEAITGRVLL